MKKLFVVVDMQNDFITGALGTAEAKEIVSSVAQKINEYKEKGYVVSYTKDTHFENYLSTQEGSLLPVRHCVKGTFGWDIEESLKTEEMLVFNKETFGSIELAEFAKKESFEEIVLCGVCTDICVITNAYLLKTYLPEAKIKIESTCCAGTTPENHKNALKAMSICQIEII